MKKVSIIIPCKSIDQMTEKCIIECLNLDYKKFEIIILPDEADQEISKKYRDKKIKILATGKVKPSLKRNIGMKSAKGNFFAFIDSDAYPAKDWLKNAAKYFDDEKIGIVGGPNLTPEQVNIWEVISGYVLGNFFVSGNAYIRYKTAENQFAHELPSCNYISRKEASSEYDSSLLTAEDSEFCFNASKKGFKILYAKDAVVYHHRRDSLRKHLKQMFVYGRDIALLTKKDFSSDKIYYSLLSVFVIAFFTMAIISFASSFFKIIFLSGLSLYLLIMFLTSIHKNFTITLLTFVASVLTHFSYGFGWLKGIFPKMPKKLQNSS